MSGVRTRKWNGTVLLGGGGEVPGWSNPFVADWGQTGSLVGILEPIGGTNVGAGKYQDRPFPTATMPTTGLPTGVTYNTTTKRFTVAAGVTIQDKVIPGFLTLSDGAVAINCHIAGPPAEVTTGQAMVEGPTTIGQGELRWCTIDPNVASSYYDGIGRGIRAHYCDVTNITDGVRGYSSSVNGVRVQCYATEFHHAAQFRPDVATGSRPETHNDVGVQGQGNPNGNDTDLAFYGCRINARHSLTKGTIPATRAQIAAIMVTPSPSAGLGAVHLSYVNGWLYGGIFCVNAGSDGVNDYGPSSLTVTGTRFEKPGTDIFGDGRAPDIAFACDPTLAVVHFGNTYLDGTPVPKTNA